MKKNFWYYLKMMLVYALGIIALAEFIACPIITIAYFISLLSDWDLSPEGVRVVVVLAFFLIYYIGKRCS